MKNYNSLKQLLLLVFITISIGTYGQTEAEHAERFNDVITSYENDDIPGAVSILQELSEKNYPPAVSYLGNLYYSGHGVSENPEKALELWRRAAAKGDSNACYSLGVVYYNGEGVSKDFKKAVDYFKCGAREKIIPSSKDFYPLVGEYLYDNHRYDEAASVYLVLNSDDYEPIEGIFNILIEIAEEGNPEAAYQAGEVYSRGSAVEKDKEKAIKWYKVAADMGHVEAQKETGRLLTGSQAMEYLKKAAGNGNDNAMMLLAENYRDGNNVSRNTEQALYWFKRAYKESSNSYFAEEIFKIYKDSGSSSGDWVKFATDVDGNTFYYHSERVTSSDKDDSGLVYIQISFQSPEYDSGTEKYFDYKVEGLEVICDYKATILQSYGYSRSGTSGVELLRGFTGSYETDGNSVFATLQDLTCD